MPSFTPTQGRYLSFIRAYTEGFGVSPAEFEIAEGLKVTPPAASQMLRTLEKKNLIKRRPGEPLAIELLIDAEEIPEWKGKRITRMVHEWVKVEPKKAKAQGASRTSGSIYCFKITLEGIRPPIWRRIETADVTLGKLHEHIQTAMGWTNSHLHQFKIGGERYTDPRMMVNDFDDLRLNDSTSVRISELVSQHGPKLRMKYEYDFGDGWEHSILLEKVLDAEPKVKYPRCTAGQRACPPEDIGGVYGYEEFLKAINDPQHKQHDDYIDWIGEIDSEAFHPKQATQAMRKGLPEW